MKKHLIILASVMTLNGLQAQQPLTPEKLWELHRVSAIALTPDQQYVIGECEYSKCKGKYF